MPVLSSRVSGARELPTLDAEADLRFAAGFGPAMARAFPANAACFLGVELSLKMMNKAF